MEDHYKMTFMEMDEYVVNDLCNQSFDWKSFRMERM